MDTHITVVEGVRSHFVSVDYIHVYAN